MGVMLSNMALGTKRPDIGFQKFVILARPTVAQSCQDLEVHLRPFGVQSPPVKGIDPWWTEVSASSEASTARFTTGDQIMREDL